MATVPRSRGHVAALVLLAALGVVAGSGCTPKCERVCEKALECDLTPRLNELECVESCRQR